MIDLHLHTTASDGRLSPAELVARVAAAGITTMAVTDHDTVAGLGDVGIDAVARGIRLVPGIEITSIADGRDVHVLGYFFDPSSQPLETFLIGQRALRSGRVREIAARLAALGMPVDADAVLLAASKRPGSSVGRPQLARALVAAGHVGSVQEAFERWLATGRPAFVPRTGPTPATVVDIIHAAGGIASMAHPGVTKRDELIKPLVDHGLDALEVYHSDHTFDVVQEYRGLAQRLGVLVSGGSDFHGEDPLAPTEKSRARRSTLGVIALPADAFAALEARAGDARRAS